MHSRGERYQIALIFLGLIALGFFAVFLYRELFPEYRIYQNDYVELEKFRSTYTQESPAAFEFGVKQIVLLNDEKGPPIIDRCVSCHVALKDPHFSPTTLTYDSEGKILRDAEGIPVKIANKDYIWEKLDSKIAELRDEQVIAQLRKDGAASEVNERLKSADKLESLKTAHVGEHVYDVTKVLSMHPLIGKETRPFEFHPVEDYGCVYCHNGNGRGLTTEKAHGPIFDGQYNIEFMGPHMRFTESDPENDPKFAYEFNNKPDSELLFQTTPLFIGPLIESKCMQCHQLNTVQDLNKDSLNAQTTQSSSKNDVRSLTKHFQLGQELYISQACYTCHRIAGFSRGGVGPDLTQIGNSYPWYIKESIVWPQADLKTSTMPNYHLDHEEVEDLMTFLLAQKGGNRILGPEAYKTAIQAWEAGRKQDWEKPISPYQVKDLNYAMTVFAVEGCAACHRLQGYQSNIGFTVQKDKDHPPSFEALYKEHEWFKRLIPEDILGSDLVEALDKHQQDIDNRIIDNVRENSLLEEIEKEHPGQIEALYTPFKYASRAKNAYYSKLISDESDTEKKHRLQQEQQQWKDRVNRVLMIYIQEYGLGRLICPRPNWSGVFRTDEWLMEHFRNPSSHVPNSIMPAFPFDDSKFYALTNMLNILSIRNRDMEREMWQHNGFSPELAFEIHCAQCHGESRNGQGPVAEWIYPLPKNLRNAEFLRNLTKERAIQSITHGVKGTPMPPWGEVAKDKPNDDIPILSLDEIQALVDWLFTGLAGQQGFGQTNAVPKWEYQPEDVLKELKQEGNELKSKDLQDVPLSGFSAFENAYASLNPAINTSDIAVKEVFDIGPNPVPGAEQRAFYIKKKFYTEENIAKGREFFELNCAPCHGKEADGTGLRAEVMQDAKPRMLINLDWINTRDDLRLLRSIKYGVPGTSMTPWGDLTSSLQRLQLVIFIRSLSEVQHQRSSFLDALYKAFDANALHVASVRAKRYASIQRAKNEYDQAKAKRIEIYQEVEKGMASPEEALKLYQKELELLGRLQQEEANDKPFLELKQTIEREKAIFKEIGFGFLAHNLNAEIFNDFVMLTALKDRWYEKDKLLQMYQKPEEEQQIKDLQKKIVEGIDQEIAAGKNEKLVLETSQDDDSNKEKLNAVTAHLNGITNFRKQIVSAFQESDQLVAQEKVLYKEIEIIQNKTAHEMLND